MPVEIILLVLGVTFQKLENGVDEVGVKQIGSVILRMVV